MHPSIKIIGLVVLALVMHVLSHRALWLMTGISGMFLLYYRVHVFTRMLKRVRWLLIFMLLIFAFNTPGEYLPQWPFEIAPTYEGLEAGVLQAVRLCLMLAGISLLLSTTSREDLMAGFFLLLYPLRYLKLSPERFAARLWLTLHYVDHDVEKSQAGLFERLTSLKEYDGKVHNGPEQIEMLLPKLTWRDVLAVTVLFVGGIYLL